MSAPCGSTAEVRHPASVRTLTQTICPHAPPCASNGDGDAHRGIYPVSSHMCLKSAKAPRVPRLIPQVLTGGTATTPATVSVGRSTVSAGGVGVSTGAASASATCGIGPMQAVIKFIVFVWDFSIFFFVLTKKEEIPA